jgi:hypothetical protein
MNARVRVEVVADATLGYVVSLCYLGGGSKEVRLVGQWMLTSEEAHDLRRKLEAALMSGGGRAVVS